MRTIAGIPASYVERILLCGKCEKSTISIEQASKAFKMGLSSVVERFMVLTFRGRIFEKVTQKPKTSVHRSLDSQIQKLKEKLQLIGE